MTNGIDYLNASWNYPSIIHSGTGKISKLAKACKGLGMSAPLLVTDPGLAELPMVGEAVAQCDHAGLRCGLFSNIQANPTGQNVADGVIADKAGNHDGVIAFGGGSGLDAAKAVALMVGRVETPLIEPDMQISRIRLSDKTSRFHPRLATPKLRQTYETVVPVEMRQKISPTSTSPDFVLVA